MNRHFVRSIIFQTLFECDFLDAKESDIPAILRYTLSDFNNVEGDLEALARDMQNTVMQVFRKKEVIDEIIVKAAPEWPIDKIAAVDRNVLRLGIYELLFENHDKVPEKVAINEAIELAKEFGSETSSKFVNGVIGAVYREIGEPGKEVVAKPKKEKSVPKEKQIEQKIGVMIYNKEGEELKFCMVHDIFGYWTLVKVKVLGEDFGDEAILQIVKEKTNLDVTLGEKIGENEYETHHPEKQEVIRKVEYRLAHSPLGEPKLREDVGGLDNIRWFTLPEIAELTIYDDVAKIIASGIKKLTE